MRFHLNSVVYLAFSTFVLIAGLGVTADKQFEAARMLAEDLTPADTADVTNQHTSESTTPILEIAATPVLGAIGPVDYPTGVNPLTGLQVDDPAVLERRPLVVKISNAPPLVRPQAGISEADLVFEHYAEGGLTRFSAIFYSHAPERVGSIRSARLIDYELVPMYRGLLAFSGASIGVEKRIYGSEEVEARINGAGDVAPAGYVPPSEFADKAYKGVLHGFPYYWRDETIPVPHNMFANVRALWELAASEGHGQNPRLTGMAFHPDPPSGSSGPGTRADIRYRATRVQWTYNAVTGRYNRFSDGSGHFDANTRQQVTAANVVIVFAGHYLTDIVESVWQGNVSWSVQITVWPEGDAILLRDGRRYDGRWIRAVREDLISLETDEGEVLYLKPGNTWFQLVQVPELQNPAEEWVVVE